MNFEEIEKVCKIIQEDVTNLKTLLNNLSNKVDILIKKDSQNIYLTVLDSVGSFQKISEHYNSLIKIRNCSKDQKLKDLINSLTNKLFENMQDAKSNNFKTTLDVSTWDEVSSLKAYCSECKK